MFEFLRRLLGLTPATPPARIFLCSDKYFTLSGIYTNHDFAALRQIVADRRLLGKLVPRILWEVARPVPGCDEYAIILWWQFGQRGSACVEETGPYDTVAERAGAMQRSDTDKTNRYSVAVDVTDAVMAREPGYV